MAYKIVFIGSNPSQRSKSIVPFWHDTRSNKVLSSWVTQLEPGCIESLHYLNVAWYPTPGNRPLKQSEIVAALPRLNASIEGIVPDKIVTLGKTADKALTLLGVEHFAMPHPSGRNRLLNDKEYVAQKIEKLREYLSLSNDPTRILD